MIPYIAIDTVTGIAFVVMLSSNYVTNILLVFYLLAVATMALSRTVLITSGFLVLGLLTYFIAAKGDIIGFDTRATVICLVFLSLVFLVLYILVINTG